MNRRGGSTTPAISPVIGAETRIVFWFGSAGSFCRVPRGGLKLPLRGDVRRRAPDGYLASLAYPNPWNETGKLLTNPLGAFHFESIRSSSRIALSPHDCHPESFGVILSEAKNLSIFRSRIKRREGSRHSLRVNSASSG